MLRMPIVFVAPETTPGSYTGALGGPPLIKEWIEKEKSKILYKLYSSLPHIDFVHYTVTTVEEARKVVEIEKGSIGFVVILLHTWSRGATRVFIESGKPVILIAESYGGGGEFLIEFGRALSEGRRVVGVSIRDLADDIVVDKVRLLETLYRLASTKIIFILADGQKFEYIRRVLKESFNIEAIYLDGREFAEKYYKVVDENEARKWANEWISNASKVFEDHLEDILKAAKLYLAMKKALQDYNAIAIAVDCINLFDKKVLDAWPCLGFMQLWLDGYVPVCEADPHSAIALLIGWYLAGRPGFVSDPVIDYTKNEIIYYHCYSPINPFGGNKKVPYIITPAHLGLKRASIYVELPVDEEIIAVQIWPEQKTIAIHRGKAIGNEYGIHACATKLVAKVNAKVLARNWRWSWHRVVFYGNLAENLKDFATLIGFHVREEDVE
ncbi:MAG: hypothetical protein QXT53_04955 [Ignisphaera sp.]